MRFSFTFTKIFLVLLWYSLPVLGGIALLISLGGLLLAQLEGLPTAEGLYLAWVTGTTVGYGDLTPASGATRVVAVIIALVGIPLNGLIAGLAVVAARLAIDRSGRLGKLVRHAEERLKSTL